jgi:hypothetical protein
MPSDIIEIFPDGRREVRFRPLLPEQVSEAMVELCLGYRHAIYQLQVSPLLALTTYDIYLNEVAYWRNVPEKVYNYYIGGYQVIKNGSPTGKSPFGPPPNPGGGPRGDEYGPPPGRHRLNGTGPERQLSACQR